MTTRVSQYPSLALGALKSWSRSGLLLLTADKGHVSDDDLNNRPLPTPVPHGGCYSFSVNFVALAEWFRHSGGTALLPAYRDPRLLVAAYTTQSEFNVPTVSRDFLHEWREFSPGDYHQIVRRYGDDDCSLELHNCLALIRFSAHEPLVFYSLRKKIREAVVGAGRRDKEAVREMLQTVYRRFYAWGNRDIPFAIAHVYQKIGDFTAAIERYRESLRIFGDHPRTLCNLADCLVELDSSDEARDVIGRALAMRPDSVTAKRLADRVGIQTSV